MVKIELKPELAVLLREVLATHDPEMLGSLREGDLVELDAGQADRVRSAVTAELGSTGFDEGWEPTERGLELEALIDEIGRPFM